MRVLRFLMTVFVFIGWGQLAMAEQTTIPFTLPNQDKIVEKKIEKALPYQTNKKPMLDWPIANGAHKTTEEAKATNDTAAHRCQIIAETLVKLRAQTDTNSTLIQYFQDEQRYYCHSSST